MRTLEKCLYSTRGGWSGIWIGLAFAFGFIKGWMMIRGLPDRGACVRPSSPFTTIVQSIRNCQLYCASIRSSWRGVSAKMDYPAVNGMWVTLSFYTVRACQQLIQKWKCAVDCVGGFFFLGMNGSQRFCCLGYYTNSFPYFHLHPETRYIYIKPDLHKKILWLLTRDNLIMSSICLRRNWIN